MRHSRVSGVLSPTKRVAAKQNPYQRPLPYLTRPMTTAVSKPKLLQPTVNCGELRREHVGQRGLATLERLIDHPQSHSLVGSLLSDKWESN